MRELADARDPVGAAARRRRPHAARARGLSLRRVRQARRPRRPSSTRDDGSSGSGASSAAFHAVGAQRALRTRPALDATTFGTEPRDYLLAHELHSRATCATPGRPRPRSRSPACTAATSARATSRRCACTATATSATCCGDGGAERGPHFVDFDDARTGPGDPGPVDAAVRRSRRDDAPARRRARGLRATSASSTRASSHLVEALRTLRLLHYSAWIARRWDDPAFPAAFPWFNTQRYWQDRILELREQIAAMDEPPLAAT